MNRTLSIFARVIPYFPQLRSLAGGVTATILMQQLEYWFDKSGGYFYKFLEPAEKGHPYYKHGDSWTEELGYSKDEFRTAFDKIGVRHKSRTQYEKAVAAGKAFTKSNGDEVYYCSYFDNQQKLTFYFRNDGPLDNAIEILMKTEPIRTDRESQSVGVGNPDFPRLAFPIRASGETQSLLYTEEYIQKTTSHRLHTQDACVREKISDFENQDSGKQDSLPQDFSLDSQEEINPSSSVNKIPHPELDDREFDNLEQSNIGVENLKRSPNGRYLVPWENPGQSLNRKFNDQFGEFLYKAELIRYSGFTKEGYPENRTQTRNYLMGVHRDDLRLEKTLAIWNDYQESLKAPQTQESPQAPLEGFLTQCGEKLRAIVLDANFTPEELAYISEVWEACDQKENLTIEFLKKAGLA